MPSSQIRPRSIPWLAALTALLLGAFALAQNEVTFVREGDTLSAPATLEGGYTTVIFDNQSDQAYELSLVRIDDDVTMDQFESLAQAAENGTGEDLAALLDASTIYGGPASVPPGSSGSVGVTLDEGTYIASASNFEGGTEARATFEVMGSSGAEPPAVDRDVVFVDFAFGIDATMPAGEQAWRVSNRGTQLHHMLLFPIQPGTTLDDIEEAMSQPGDPAFVIGPPAVTIAAMSPGVSNDVTVDLAPGSYAAICFVPDAETGAPHAALGMIALVEVTGN